MPALEILSVSIPDETPGPLLGSSVDRPQPGERTDDPVLHVAAWVIGQRSPAAAVEVARDGEIVAIAPLRMRRPDLSAAFPDVPEAGTAGMAVDVDTTAFPPEFELLLTVLLQDGERVEIGSIAGRRGEPSEAPEPVPAAPTLREDVQRLLAELAPPSGTGDRHTAILERLALRGKKVLDIGSDLGETSRAARSCGAAVVDGIEPDAERVRIARLLNAHHHATRVSFFERDVASADTYEEQYDVVLALSGVARIEPVLDRVAQITDGVLVATVDGEAEIAAIGARFRHRELLGEQVVAAAHSPDRLEAVLGSVAQAAP